MKICVVSGKTVPLHTQIRNEARLYSEYRGVEQLVARQAHNLEVACSSPASATFYWQPAEYQQVVFICEDEPGGRQSWPDFIIKKHNYACSTPLVVEFFVILSPL